MGETASAAPIIQRGQVMRLDRGYPLVRLEPDGRCIRCEHAAALVKLQDWRATVGDYVEVELLQGGDRGILTSILPRQRVFVRKDPAERAAPQVLAANFDCVMVAQPLSAVNARRLERELVLAHGTGAKVAVLLTKADLAESAAQVSSIVRSIADLAGPDVIVRSVAVNNAESVEQVRALIPANTTAVLLGKSGVGKSSLVNLLAGSEVQATAAVREGDGKGRHTTVSRAMVPVQGGGFVIDMPGVRGLGLWDCAAGIDAAFADIVRLASQCRFRDCQHGSEPGCAVRAAIDSGELAASRLASYQELCQEMADQEASAEQARRRCGEKRPHGSHGSHGLYGSHDLSGMSGSSGSAGGKGGANSKNNKGGKGGKSRRQRSR